MKALLDDLLDVVRPPGAEASGDRSRQCGAGRRRSSTAGDRAGADRNCSSDFLRKPRAVRRPLPPQPGGYQPADQRGEVHAGRRVDRADGARRVAGPTPAER